MCPHYVEFNLKYNFKYVYYGNNFVSIKDLYGCHLWFESNTTLPLMFRPNLNSTLNVWFRKVRSLTLDNLSSFILPSNIPSQLNKIYFENCRNKIILLKCYSLTLQDFSICYNWVSIRWGPNWTPIWRAIRLLTHTSHPWPRLEPFDWDSTDPNWGAQF